MSGESNITVGDLKLTMEIIAGSCARGGIWAAADLTRIGVYYDKLATIVAKYEEANKQAAGAAEADGAGEETKDTQTE